MAKIGELNTSGENAYPMKEALQRKKTDIPQKSYNWRVRLPDLSDFSKLDAIRWNEEAGAEAEALESVKFNMAYYISERIVNASVPFSTVETDKHTVGNSYWYYGKQNDIGQISFEINEFQDHLTLRWLNAWQRLMMNDNGTYNPPVVYKRDLILYRLSSNKKDIFASKYKNYFVSGIADIANDYETNEIIRYAVQLTGDEVEHFVFSTASLIDDPSERDRLAEILSVDSALESIDIALQGAVSEATGLNLPGVKDIAGGIGSLF